MTVAASSLRNAKLKPHCTHITDFVNDYTFNNLDGNPSTHEVVENGFTYDADNRLYDIDHITPTAESLHAPYNRDIAGRITSFYTSGNVDEYQSDITYDNDNQIVNVATSAGYSPSIPSASFSYDPNGNQDSTGFTTNSDNQLAVAPATDGSGNYYNYSYDHEGNRTQSILKNASGSTLQTVNYTWDYRNRLVEVETLNGSSVETQDVKYVYNAFDQRIAMVLDSDGNGTVDSTESYYYDGTGTGNINVPGGANVASGSGNLILTLTGSGHTVLRRYLMGDQPNQVFAEETVGGSNTTRWALTDHEGSVRDIVDNTGHLLDYVVYSVYGEILSQSDAGQAMKPMFDGMIYDVATGLYSDTHRFLDADQHVFISVDPMGYAAGQTNLTEFVGNDPLMETDTSGLDVVSGMVVDAILDRIEGMTAKEAQQELEKVIAEKGGTLTYKDLQGVMAKSALKGLGELHHIVVQKLFDDPKISAWFEKIGINKDVATNIVLLPRGGEQVTIDKILEGAIHRGATGKAYYQEVEEAVLEIKKLHVAGELDDAGAKSAIAKLQADLRKKLLSGELKINKAVDNRGVAAAIAGASRLSPTSAPSPEGKTCDQIPPDDEDLNIDPELLALGLGFSGMTPEEEQSLLEKYEKDPMDKLGQQLQTEMGKDLKDNAGKYLRISHYTGKDGFLGLVGWTVDLVNPGDMVASAGDLLIVVTYVGTETAAILQGGLDQPSSQKWAGTGGGGGGQSESSDPTARRTAEGNRKAAEYP